MTSTGKAARRRHGTRFAAKRAKQHKRKSRRTWDRLPVSVAGKTAEQFVRDHSGPLVC